MSHYHAAGSTPENRSMAACCASAETLSAPNLSADATPGKGQTRVRIEQMDCPTEEKLIRDKLSGMQGISAIEFNLMQRVLILSHEPHALAPALAAIRELGFSPVTEHAGQSDTEASVTPRKQAWWPLALAGLTAMAAEVMHFAALQHFGQSAPDQFPDPQLPLGRAAPFV